MVVVDGVPDDQRLVGGLLGIGEGEADKIVVVCATAEDSLLAPDERVLVRRSGQEVEA